MRFLTTSLVTVAALLAITACSGKSDSDQSNAAATSSADAGAMGTPSAAATDDTTSTASPNADMSSGMAKGDEVPTYPGATTQASGSSSGMGAATAMGKVLSTSDSFADVYAWYQKNLPAGSEKAHVTTPVESAIFTIGEPGKGQTSVTINTNSGKTMITIAHVKM